MRLGLSAVLVLIILLSGCVGLPEPSGDVSHEQPPEDTAVQGTESRDGPEDTGNGSERHVTSSFPECGDGPVLTVPPIGTDNITGIVPLGNLAPPSHTFPTRHMYLDIRRTDPEDWESRTVEVPVRAPADITVTRIVESNSVRDGVPIEDYSVHFTACREWKGYFLHMASLSDRLAATLERNRGECTSYSTGVWDVEQCEATADLEVEAGEVMGTAGGGTYRDAKNAMDFGAFDTRVDHRMANPERWTSGTGLENAVCPLDYYPEDLRSELKELLWSAGKQRPDDWPVCGTVEQDVAGTASGMWFAAAAGGHGPEDPHLSLVRYNHDPSKLAFSVGTTMREQGVDPGVYLFDPEEGGKVNIRFRDVTPGTVHCYAGLESTSTDMDGPEMILLVELLNENTLLIEKRDDATCGDGPWTIAKGSQFER